MKKEDTIERKVNRSRWLQLGLLLLPVAARGQSSRLNDFHSLAWVVYTGDHQVARQWAIHTEAQLRRVDLFYAPQQELYRLGLVRTLSDRLQVSGGYTALLSHRYGPYAEVPGRVEPEHRAYEDVTLKDQLGRLGLRQRIRLEQRWLGSRGGSGEGPVQKWEYQNRIRYQLAFTLPLQGSALDDHELYLNGFDELFIGFGQNVDRNVFNQNRLSGGLGYQFTKNAQVELNYLYQVRAHAVVDAASGRPVVELNNGFRLNVVYNLDFTKG